MKRVLFLSGWYPYPTTNGSKLRIFNLLRGLAQNHEVTLLAFAEDGEVTETPEQLSAICRRVLALPARPYRPTGARALAGLFALRPRVVVDTHSPVMARAIRTAVASESPHAVVASEWTMAAYCREFGSVPALFDDAEYGVLVSRCETAATAGARLRHRLPLWKLKHYLRRILPRFDAVTVVSEQERRLLGRLAPGYGHVHTVPNCVDAAAYQRSDVASEPGTLIFTGPFSYEANYDAMQWFLAEIFPRIRERVPGVRLDITGDHRNLSLPDETAVRRVGFVEDLPARLASSWVSIAPLRIGGGTRLKILEAMAAGTPVVSTRRGAEGLDLVDGDELLLADKAEPFADAVVCMLRDPELREHVATRALERVKSTYDWRHVMPSFVSLVERVSSGAARVDR